MSLFAPTRRYVATLIDPSAQHDAITATGHRALIVPRLLEGAPLSLEGAPIRLTDFLSCVGGYESAHMHASPALTRLLTIVGGPAGGIASFAVVWLVAVALEAALSASLRVVAFASMVGLGAAAILASMSALCSVELRVRRDRPDARGRTAAQSVWIEMRCHQLEQTTGAGTRATVRPPLDCEYDRPANGKRPPQRHLPPQAHSSAARQAPPPGGDTPVKNSA